MNSIRNWWSVAMVYIIMAAIGTPVWFVFFSILAACTFSIFVHRRGFPFTVVAHAASNAVIASFGPYLLTVWTLYGLGWLKQPITVTQFFESFGRILQCLL